MKKMKVNLFLCCFLIIIILNQPILAEEEILQVPVGQSQLLSYEKVERVAVANPEIAEVVVVSKNEVLLNGVAEGVTTLHLWSGDGYQRKVIRTYHDYSFTAEQIEAIIDQPEIQVTKVKDTIILKGTVEDIHQKKKVIEIAGSFGEKVIDLIEMSQPLQVLIRAYVVEVNQEKFQELGLEWGGMTRGVFKPGQMLFGELNLNSLPTRLDLLGIQLNALAEQDLTRILAAPDLITMSGVDAEILVGGEIPIVKANDIVWKPYGIILSMNPQVLSNGKIQVSLEPEVSTLDWDNAIQVGEYQYPAFRTRRVKTQVTVESGSTIVLGGLISKEQAEKVQKVPFLGDLPIFGELFQSRQFRKGDTELVVMVQAWILNDSLLEEINQEKESFIIEQKTHLFQDPLSVQQEETNDEE